MDKDYHYDLNTKDVMGKEVVFTKGLGQANIHNRGQTRDFEEIEKNLFPKLMTAGIINYGLESKYDERKYRLNKPLIEESKIIVPLGLTHFRAYSADIERGDEANRFLQSIGECELDDKWAYFSRTLCAMFIPITKDGSVFIGEKTSNNSYNGWLISAAGHVDYHGTPSFEKFQSQAINELREEYGKRLNLIGPPKFLGISSHPLKGDANAVWTGRIDVDSEYFSSGKWLEERMDIEHASKLVRISTIQERDQLLKKLHLSGRDFKGIVYATRFGLEALTEQDFSSL